MPEDNEDLHVKVSTPTKVLFEGVAESVSSENTQGNFDILPYHADFVTLIQRKAIVIRTEGREKQFSFKNAVIHVTKNKLRIYGDVE